MSAPIQCCCNVCWKVFSPCCAGETSTDRRYVSCPVFDSIQWLASPEVFKIDGVCWQRIEEEPPVMVPREKVVSAEDLTDLFELCNGIQGSGACCEVEVSCYYRASPCTCVGQPLPGDWLVKCSKIDDANIPRGILQYIKVSGGPVPCWLIDTTIVYGEIPSGWSELTFTEVLSLEDNCFECCTTNQCCGCNGTVPPYCPPYPAYATVAWQLTDPGTDGIGESCQCIPPDALVTQKVYLSNCDFGCKDNGGFATNQGCLGRHICCLACVPASGGGCPPLIFWRISFLIEAVSTFDYDLWLSSGGNINACGDCNNPVWANNDCDSVPCGVNVYEVRFRTPNMEKCTCVPDASQFTIIEFKSPNVTNAALVSLA